MGGAGETREGGGRGKGGGKKERRVVFSHPDIPEEETVKIVRERTLSETESLVLQRSLSDIYETAPSPLPVEGVEEEEEFGEEEEDEEGSREMRRSLNMLRDRSMSLPFGNLKVARSTGKNAR